MNRRLTHSERNDVVIRYLAGESSTSIGLYLRYVADAAHACEGGTLTLTQPSDGVRTQPTRVRVGLAWRGQAGH